MASNDFQIVVGDDFNISQMCVATIITHFVDSLIQHINEYISFPNEGHRKISMNNFYQMARFPKVIGCVDATHIKITAPSEDSDDYINRKSITLSTCKPYVTIE